MSDTGTPARPRQLTMAGGFVIGGSVLLLLTAFDAIATLNSLETREAVAEWVGTAPGEGMGLSLEETLAARRWGLSLTAVCAAAAAVLGIYALQRNRAARVALTVLAVPILLTAPLTGGLMGALVAVSTLMLWSGPARDWFAGRPVREVGPAQRQSRPGPWETTMPSPEDRNRGQEGPPDPPPADPPTDGSATGYPSGNPSGNPDVPAASELSTAGSSTAPVPTSGFGERLPQGAEPRSGSWAPPTYAAAALGPAVPVTVKVACILTWAFSGLVALMYLVVLFVMILAQDRMVELVVETPEWQRANLDQDVLVPALWAGVLMFLGWALGACVLAWFAWRRHSWARWLLAASAGATLLVGFFAFPVGVLHQLAAGLTIAGLFSSAAREWYARRQWTPGGPPDSSQGGPPGRSPDDPGWQHAPPPSYPSGPPQPGPGQQPPPGGKPPVW